MGRGVSHVRTAAGMRKYNLPMGAPITADALAYARKQRSGEFQKVKTSKESRAAQATKSRLQPSPSKSPKLSPEEKRAEGDKAIQAFREKGYEIRVSPAGWTYALSPGEDSQAEVFTHEGDYVPLDANAKRDLADSLKDGGTNWATTPDSGTDDRDWRSNLIKNLKSFDKDGTIATSVKLGASPGQIQEKLEATEAWFDPEFREESHRVQDALKSGVHEFTKSSVLPQGKSILPVEDLPAPDLPPSLVHEIRGFVSNNKPKEAPFDPKYVDDVSRIAVPAWRKAAEAEPQITADILKASDASGAKLFGMEFRLKTLSSSLRKVYKNAVSGKTPVLSDVNRYSFSHEESEMTQGVKSVSDSLESQGWVLLERENKWLDGNPYSDIAEKWRHPSGVTVEVQHHSPSGLAVKEELHGLFEVSRTLDKDSPESAEKLKTINSYNEDLVAGYKIPNAAYEVNELGEFNGYISPTVEAKLRDSIKGLPKDSARRVLIQSLLKKLRTANP